MQLRSCELEPRTQITGDIVHGRVSLYSQQGEEDHVDGSDAESHLSDSLEGGSTRSIPHANIEQRYCTEFDELECLGRGGFGVVHRARHRIDQMEYAVKRVDLQELVGEEVLAALSEARVMASLPPHANIVRYFASWLQENPVDCSKEDDSDVLEEVSELSIQSQTTSSSSDGQYALYIQMSLCGNGLTLAQHLKNRSREGADRGTLGKKGSQILNQIVAAVQHMHNHGFEHLDLTPRNVFQVSEEANEWCVGDFSFTSKFGLFAREEAGTHLYAAPEVSKQLARDGIAESSSVLLNGAADVFSLGVMMAELCMDFETAMERAVLLDKVRTGGGWLPSSLKQGCPQLTILIGDMLSPNPSLRPSLLHVADKISMFGMSKLEEVSEARVKLESLLLDWKASEMNGPQERALGEELAKWRKLITDPQLAHFIT